MEDKILAHIQRWAAAHKTPDESQTLLDETQTSAPSTNPDLNSARQNQSNSSSEGQYFPLNDLQLDQPTLVFENDALQMFIRQDYHQKLRKFRLQDMVYHITVKLKSNHDAPLLIDILNLLEISLTYILKEIRKFYNEEDHNELYLALVDNSLLNSLNCPAVQLQNDDGLEEAVGRILDMLYRYLISDNHINLKLNNSFKIFAHILSVNHVKYKNHLKPSYTKTPKSYGYKIKGSIPPWSLDCYKIPAFLNQCLLVALVLGLLQINYFATNYEDKRFLIAQNVASTLATRKRKAIELLLSEISQLKQTLLIESDSGPHTTSLIQSFVSKYQCQVFIFNGEGQSCHLKESYPPIFDNSLPPLYLYELPQDSNHIVFVRNIKSFFKQNVLYCFYCLRTFKDVNYRHRCLQDKTCFACRRPFAFEKTFLPNHYRKLYCTSKLETTNKAQPTLCSICNVTLSNIHCQLGHKRLCSGKGYFGWKCLKCQTFSYVNKEMKNASELKVHHNCETKICSKCCQRFNFKSTFHLCKLNQEKPSNFFPRLAFLSIEFLHESLPQNNWCPNLIILYLENSIKKGEFSRNVFSLFSTSCSNDTLFYPYLLNNMEVPFKSTQKEKQRTFLTETLKKKSVESIIYEFFYYVSVHNFSPLTVVLNDPDSIKMVRILHSSNDHDKKISDREALILPCHQVYNK